MDYQELKKIAVSAANDVKRTSVRLCKTAKLSLLIAKKENEVEEKLIEIGKIIYKSHCGFEVSQDDIGKLCDKIDVIKTDIKLLESKKNSIKSENLCEVCGCDLPYGESNCPNCGCEL